MRHASKALAIAAAAILAILALAGPAGAQQPATQPAAALSAEAKAPAWSAAVVLEKGIYTEETLGDLDAAIKIYRQIVERAEADQKYVAQAQYRLGMCYLKKNDKAKAYTVFTQLVLEFPYQKGLTEQAWAQYRKIPNEFAHPQVVRTTPAAFANNVDPALDKITVTFDRPMMDKSWSWTGGGDTFPERTGEISYDANRTTCTMPVKLQPGKVYWVGVNSPSHRNFQTADRVPAKWYVILFATKSADGKPTPLPEDLARRAAQINAANGPSDNDKKQAEDLAAEGWRLWNARKLSDAEEKFQAAVAKDATSANAWNGLGWAQFNQGKPINAKDSFEKAVALNPKLTGSLNGLGYIARGNGKTEEAIEYWQKAVAADPAATASLSGLAATYSELGQYDKSIEAYQQWLKAEPGNKDAKAALKKAQDAGEAAKAALPIAEQWLKLVDDGKYGDGWDSASEFLRKAISKDLFGKQIAPARTPLGKLQSRKLISATYMTSVPGAPDGQYVVIQFETSFENKKQAVETVTPMKDKDGKWRVSGYYIK